MATTRCKHGPTRPFAGMKRRGLSPDGGHVQFVCPICEAEYLAPRCVEHLDGDRGRCRNSALTGRSLCIMHWVLTPEDDRAVRS